MNKLFCCPCLNVSIELNDEDENQADDGHFVVEWEKQSRQAIDVYSLMLQENESTIKQQQQSAKETILRRHFLNSSSHFTVKSNDYHKEQDLTPSCVKIVSIHLFILIFGVKI